MLLWSGVAQLLAFEARQAMAVNLKKRSEDHRRPLSPRVRTLVITTVRVLISSIANRRARSQPSVLLPLNGTWMAVLFRCSCIA